MNVADKEKSDSDRYLDNFYAIYNSQLVNFDNCLSGEYFKKYINKYLRFDELTKDIEVNKLLKEILGDIDKKEKEMKEIDESLKKLNLNFKNSDGTVKTINAYELLKRILDQLNEEESEIKDNKDTKIPSIKFTRTVEIPVEVIFNDVRKALKQNLHEECILDNYEEVEELAKTLDNFNTIDNQTIKEMWTEYCSDDFFNLHPKVSDVIMVIKELNGEALDKVWVCRNVYL